MKKRLIAITMAMALILSFGGCSSGVKQEVDDSVYTVLSYLQSEDDAVNGE